MRISDWSSDVCSSDLIGEEEQAVTACRGEIVLHRHPADDRPQIIAEVKIARGLNARDDPHLGFPSSTLEVGEHFRVEGTDHPRHAEIDDAAGCDQRADAGHPLTHRSVRSEEHTSELQSLMRNSYAV